MEKTFVTIEIENKKELLTIATALYRLSHDYEREYKKNNTLSEWYGNQSEITFRLAWQFKSLYKKYNDILK